MYITISYKGYIRTTTVYHHFVRFYTVFGGMPS